MHVEAVTLRLGNSGTLNGHNRTQQRKTIQNCSFLVIINNQNKLRFRILFLEIMRGTNSQTSFLFKFLQPTSKNQIEEVGYVKIAKKQGALENEIKLLPPHPLHSLGLIELSGTNLRIFVGFRTHLKVLPGKKRPLNDKRVICKFLTVV